MPPPAPARSLRSRRNAGRSSGCVDAATDLRLARERLAALSRLSEHATEQVDRAEFALVKALRDRRAGSTEVEAARRRLVDAQDAALQAFFRAHAAARAVTIL